MLAGGEETYTSAKVREILVAEGHEPGTPEFCAAMDERFLPVDDGLWTDNPN